jgi:hypothetical protein
MKIDAILIKEEDNVATALRDIQPQEKIVVGIGEKTRRRGGSKIRCRRNVVSSGYGPIGFKIGESFLPS